MRGLSDVLSVASLLATASASCTGGSTLFFSQFQEASTGTNKYYQIYNPTDAAIDLAAGYTIAFCDNGCAEEGKFESTQPSG